MSAVTALGIQFQIPEERKTSDSAISLMKIGNKTMKPFKNVKRKNAANKKGLYKSKFNLLPDYNQIFTSLMNLQSPHPELDPRLKYNPIYFHPTHPYYSKSVLRLLSYALSSSLNNYYTLLKGHGVVIAKQSQSPQERKEQQTRRSRQVQSKKTANIKYKNILVAQAKNDIKKVVQEPERVKRVQKCLQKCATKARRSSEEFKDIILKNEAFKSANYNTQTSFVVKTQDLQLNQDYSLTEEIKLPKFGMEAYEGLKIRENLLMRQVRSWPVKQRPAGISREVRSLYN